VSWRDNLLPGSYKGIPFHVESHEYTSGRRTSPFYLIDETEGKEKVKIRPTVEDSGRETREFSLELYVIQNDAPDRNYFTLRDSLINAFEEYGTGLLIHPYMGEVECTVLDKYKMSEKWDEGGIARFSVTFIETVIAEPRRTSESDNKIEDKKKEVDDIALDNLADNYEASGVFQDNTATAIVGMMTKISENMYQILSSANSYVNEAISEMSSIIQTVDDIIDFPCDVGYAILNTVNKVSNVIGLGVETITGGIVGGCSGVIRNARELNGTSVPENMGISTTRALITSMEYNPVEDVFVPEEQKGNIATVRNTFSVFCITTGCVVLIHTEFSNQEKLIEYMNLFTTAIDEVLTRIGDETADIKTVDVFNAIQDMRNLFINEMLIKNTSIAKTNYYKVGPGTTSALQLAYELYGDLDRMQDIYNRNKAAIAHPGFLPGGERLKVLSE